MTNTNFLQCGEVTACGHCQPDKYGEGLKQAIAGGFDETKCECKCHKPMTNTTLREEFENKFGYVFDVNDLSAKPINTDVLDFIEFKVNEAEKRGEANMKYRVQCLIDDNDDYQMFEWAFKKL